MALSVVEVLERFGRIDQDALARAFARRFVAEPYRGYASGAMSLLGQIANGADWRTAAPALFSGGSYGNGGAMRAAPIGGYFCVIRRVPLARPASLRWSRTRIPRRQAGAMAVAAAAALAAQPSPAAGPAFLRSVLRFVPEGLTHRKIQQSIDLPGDDLGEAVRVLGTGDNPDRAGHRAVLRLERGVPPARFRRCALVDGERARRSRHDLRHRRRDRRVVVG